MPTNDFNFKKHNLPGGKLFPAGIEDLKNKKETLASLLISIAAQNLSELGLKISQAIEFPEKKLYVLLSKQYDLETHTVYNSYLRLLISFEKTLACVK